MTIFHLLMQWANWYRQHHHAIICCRTKVGLHSTCNPHLQLSTIYLLLVPATQITPTILPSQVQGFASQHNWYWHNLQSIKAFFGKNSRFCIFSEVCTSFQLFVWPLQPTKFISDMSVSKFEVSIAQPLPKLAMAIRLHLRHKNAHQQNFYIFEVKKRIHNNI